MIPTADDVARAIIGACKETGGDPIAVAQGVGGRHPKFYPHTRARIYAAFALKKAFPDVPQTTIARLCQTQGDATAFFSQAAANARSGRANWFSDAAIDRVVARMGGYSAPVPIPAAPRPPVQREAPNKNPRTGRFVPAPAPALGKRAVYDMLAEAVRNTAAKTPPPED